MQSRRGRQPQQFSQPVQIQRYYDRIVPLKVTRYMSFRTPYFWHLCAFQETRHHYGERLYVPSVSQ
jgi:hypothetical protein